MSSASMRVYCLVGSMKWSIGCLKIEFVELNCEFYDFVLLSLIGGQSFIVS
jgi:hypothetical protein